MLEYLQEPMNSLLRDYQPNEYECERASNVYLMSIVIVIIGLPIPVINLIATLIVYLNNRDSTHYVRWHSLQALFSQLFVAVLNGIGLSWTLSIAFGDNRISEIYFGYIATVVLFNVMEFVATIYAAVRVRKGQHLEFWLFGPLVELIVVKK